MKMKNKKSVEIKKLKTKKKEKRVIIQFEG